MAASAPRDSVSDFPRLPDQWRYGALADLIDDERGICYGIVQPGSDQRDGIPIVRVNNIRGGRISTDDVLRVTAGIEEKYERSRLRGGEVLLTLVGSLGETAIVPDELTGWNVARAVGVIPVRDDVGPRWVQLCLRSPLCQHFMRVWATTTVQATLNLRDVAKLPIPLPPDEERGAIAAVLGALDDKIELNRRMCRTLEGIARAIFQAWFVDFEPVRAKAAGARSFRGMPQAVFDSLPTPFVDSPLGPIPKGWRVVGADDVADINACTLGRSDELEHVDYIEISEVMRGEIGRVVRYERGAEPSRARRRLRHGDTVLSTVRPDRGAHFLCLDPPATLIASTGFTVLSPREGLWAFLYSAMTRPGVGEELGRLADGGAYPAVRPEIIAGLQFVAPAGKAVAEAFQGVAGPLFVRAESARRQSRTLAAIRDALLPKLVSGEIRVRTGRRCVGASTCTARSSA